MKNPHSDNKGLSKMTNTVKKAGILGIFLSNLIVLSGCGTMHLFNTEEGFERRLDTWIGQKSVHLIEKRGIPDKTMDLPDGRKAYQYMQIMGTTGLASTSYNRFSKSFDTDGNSQFNYCKTTYFINKADIITSWAHEGDSCRAR